jgi:hypothetical protein
VNEEALTHWGGCCAKRKKEKVRMVVFTFRNFINSFAVFDTLIDAARDSTNIAHRCIKVIAASFQDKRWALHVCNLRVFSSSAYSGKQAVLRLCLFWKR